MDVVVALGMFGGSARREMLLAAGCTWDAIAASVREGRIVRRHRGVYALPSAPDDVVVARVFRAQLGCLSACDHWGLRTLRPAWMRLTPHLVVPRGRSQSRPGLRAPWEAVIHRAESFVPGELWVPCATAVDQIADCTAPIDQLIAIDAALYGRLITEEDLMRLRCGTRERREWIVARASGLSESPLETVSRVVLVEAGYPVTEQRRFDRVGRVDLVLEDGTVVEADGFKDHGKRSAFREDRRRGRELQLMGRGQLRYAFEDVVGNPLGIVRDAERQLGRTPAAGFLDRWREIVSPAGMRTANPSPHAQAALATWRP